MVVFADGADLKTMVDLAGKCAGATTNPSLMKKAGITDYRSFARQVIEIWRSKPVSFEVIADDLKTMEKQAHEISSWGENVYVKIPVTTSDGQTTLPVAESLARDGIRMNVTAVFTCEQAQQLRPILNPLDIVSVFAGRIADTGRDPEEMMMESREITRCKLLWASAREVFNVVQADRCGCDIITLTPDLISKMDGFGRDLSEYSLATVQQFKCDSEGITL